MITQDAITAALKKLGPSSPGQVADHLGVESNSLAYHLKKMLDAGTIKAAGNRNARRLALPDQDLDAEPESAPPQRRKPKKHGKAKHHAGKAKGAPPRARAAAPHSPNAAAERFIPAIDAESRLVIVNGAEPYIFTGEQTEAIATLLFQHYNEE